MFLGKKPERQLLDGFDGDSMYLADDEYWAAKERKFKDKNQGEQPWCSLKVPATSAPTGINGSFVPL
jgi:hypothetical protein